MLLEKERKEVVRYCQKIVTNGLTKGTGGNISIFNRKQGLVAISPSGLDYDRMQPEDVVVLDLEHNLVEGTRKPSTELAMHTIFYKNREDINAVIHTHSTFAKTLSALRMDLPAVSYLVACAGYDVKCAEYASFGTEELAFNAYQAMKNRKAVLLANHGLLAGAEDIKNAYNIAEQIELCCEIYYRAKSIGEPVLLDQQEMERMMEKFETYGKQ